ncbi:antibiotic biosynthesis monooxygenase family protein [Streptomyces sp. CA-249302]|uniref:antibiotic biosynthesis monooxygenase family protein n=1 Tax=Streptomyces sp. CA-249302 TaxID=3240058 RepID=UPI003D8E4FD2
MTIVETIRFKLRAEVGDADFQDRNRTMEKEYLRERPGFLARSTARSAEGEYLVTVHWATPEDAEATIGAFFGAPETQSFLAAVDLETVQPGRYELIGT